MIEVVSPGPQATVQDLGRTGYAHLGVPQAGAVDPVSLRLANRLVGNAEDAAGVEFLLGGLGVRFVDAAVFALTGAPAPARLDGDAVPSHSRRYARPGQVLTTSAAPFGVRGYLAVAGGIAVEPVMGSRSTDTLSGMGPPPLAAGARLPVGSGGGVPDSFPAAVPTSCSPDRQVTLRFAWGPREDWFAPQSLDVFATAPWAVTADTDRVGVRLSGPPLVLRDDRQLPTEGLHLGSVQVPPSGTPIVHLSNHPPTGGYPVIGVVRLADLPRLAQARPGTTVSFRPVPASPGSAWSP